MRYLLNLSLLSLLVMSCGDVKKPVFEKVENLKMGKLELTETTVSANIRFNNLNSFGMRLKKLDCDLYVDSSFAGHFSNTEPVSIRARQTFVLPISGKAQTFILMQQSRKAFAGEESYIRVKGTARVGHAGIFKTIPFTYIDTMLLSEILK